MHLPNLVQTGKWGCLGATKVLGGNEILAEVKSSHYV